MSRMIICRNCGGSGRVIEHLQYPPESKEFDCPVCFGEGRILQSIKIETRPIYSNDKVKFRKIINR